jgi:ubiquinone/menaquinone biosynthesis C-methylase UbiE
MISDARWSGPWGTKYAEQFTLEPEALDEHWQKTWGQRRSEIMNAMLRYIPREMSVLEVGCGTGNQLTMLRKMGFTDLTGIDINVFAVNKAKDRGFEASCGTMLELPFPDRSFDLVMTCGVISHMEPDRLPRAISEINRVAREYIFGTEYVTNTGHGDFMWANDYRQRFLDADIGLHPIRGSILCKSLGAGDLEAWLLARSK